MRRRRGGAARKGAAKGGKKSGAGRPIFGESMKIDEKSDESVIANGYLFGEIVMRHSLDHYAGKGVSV